MSEKSYPKALFGSLVYNEAGQAAETTHIGDDAYYIILDDDFKRHVEAKLIDQQVLAWLKGQITANKEMVTEGILNMLGKDDLFTKAMVDSSISNVDNLETLKQASLPPDALMMLGMMGFKIIVNVHGEVVDMAMPAQEDTDEFD